ncbi:winged helix-turn-helix transcriptional regulator [bacterium]|nr:winged helix-turn-helix transcriptional regulator [bacterium]
MLEPILGNSTVEKILLFLSVYGEGYGTKMSDTFKISLNGIQQQLKRLEDGGVLVSQLKGKTRIYKFNPRYFFLKELKSLLEKVLKVLSETELKKYYRQRTRPRRKGKP